MILFIVAFLFLLGALITYALMPAVAYKDAEARQHDPPPGALQEIKDTVRLGVRLWTIAGAGGLLMIAAIWLLFHH